ncbi:MAG: hypothetical protein U0X91_03110 [Spirosomataceae bacterium]
MRISLLRLVSISYLLLPNLIFAAGWFRIEFALLMIIGLSFLFWQEIKDYKQLKNKEGFTGKELVKLAGLAFVITGLTGISGYSYQLFDYWAENAKFYDLFQSDWPLYFEEVDRYACYYFGYYFVPALLSKWIGELSLFSLFIWSWVGVFMLTAWIYFLTDKKIGRVIIVLAIGGVSENVKWLLAQLNGTDLLFSSEMGPAVITPLFQQLRWAPNQVIAALMTASVLLYSLLWEKRYEKAFFSSCLCTVWCIFPTLILFVLFAAVSLYYLSKDGFRLFFKNNALTFSVCLLFLIPIAVYFASSSGGTIHHFLLQVKRPKSAVPKLFLDIGLDWGVLLAVACWFVSKRRTSSIIFRSIPLF